MRAVCCTAWRGWGAAVSRLAGFAGFVPMSSITGASSVDAATSETTPSVGGRQNLLDYGLARFGSVASVLIEAVSVGAIASAAPSGGADSVSAPKRLLSSSARERTAEASLLGLPRVRDRLLGHLGSRGRHFAGRLYDRGVARR